MKVLPKMKRFLFFFAKCGCSSEFSHPHQHLDGHCVVSGLKQPLVLVRRDLRVFVMRRKCVGDCFHNSALHHRHREDNVRPLSVPFDPALKVGVVSGQL